MAHFHRSHFIQKNDKGLVLLRKIVKSERIEDEEMKGCTKLHTEDIHPLQLFESMRIESIGESPFQHTSKERSPEDNIDKSVDSESPPGAGVRLDRKALSTIVTPDYPVTHCDISDAAYFYGSGNNYAYKVGPSQGCAEYSADLPGSFNFNYDYATGTAAIPSYDLGGGISCVNCYVFLGAGVLIIVQYKKGNFDIEAKVGGGLGYSANVNIVNPIVSSSYDIALIKGSSNFKVSSLGSSLQLGYKLGGLTATLSGSGSATGSLSFGSAQSFDSTMGVLYSSTSGLSFPTKTHSTYVSPYFNASSFQVKSLSVGLTLTVSEAFFLSYSGYITYSFSANLASSVSHSIGKHIQMFA